MPRSSRLDTPGLLQHVMARGIERCDIFADEVDRQFFVARFSALIDKSGADCLAWALMSNHLHLLLRMKETSLASFMRKLLTGHAVTFNRRHRRSGHLFQNRYKSIVCEEEPYLLELVRYIHLNPLRAGLVPDLDVLDGYPWSGHAVLMGKSGLKGQSCDEILSRFGRTVSQARLGYRAFVADGIARGKRNDLTGGRLKRSLLGDDAEESGVSDERVLGSSVFVEKVQGAVRMPSEHLPFEQLVARCAERYGIEAETLARRTRRSGVAEARSLVCYLAVRTFGYSGAEVAERLRMSRAGVSLAVGRGELLVREYPELSGSFQDN